MVKIKKRRQKQDQKKKTTRNKRNHKRQINQGNLLKNQEQENQKNPYIKKSGESIEESGSEELEEPLNMCRARTWRTKRKIQDKNFRTRGRTRTKRIRGKH